ncbi:MAG: hypothetical protein O7G86_01590 [Gammaproteobacteria bacterium]|nr:hypothetical protein [Gammaproteobacteria bacterium]
MRLPMVFAVARSEIRSSRRLVLYWLYAAAAVAVGVVTFAQFTFLHGSYSGMSATVAAVGPRYLIAQVGVNLLIVFLTGVTFLAFDVRARDVRDRMVEVLDSRPLNNAEFMTGKVTGLVFIAWLPLLLIAVLYQSFGALSGALGLPFGDAVEPISLLGYLVQTLAALFLWCSMVVLLAVVVRYRILIALIALGLVALQFWIAFNVPLRLQQWVSLTPTFVLASDIVPRFAPEGDGIRALAHLVLGIGLLCLAITLHPRRDDSSPSRMTAISLVILSAAVALLGANVWRVNQQIDQRAAWRAAHEAQQALPRVDMTSLSGSLVLKPGDSIVMDLDLEVLSPSGDSSSTLLFTLNPGITVAQIAVDGVESHWTHADGLLEIVLSTPIAPDTATRISIQAAGEPDDAFGYLDSHFNRMEGDLTNAQIAILGVKPSIFDSAYLAMTPGAHWLPSTGTDTPASNPTTHPHDYFMLDLEVEVPADWLVAGPGRRHSLGTAGEVARYRFQPSSPVPHVGLLASRFTRRTIEIANVEFEVLVYPDHDRNLKFFEDAEAAIQERLSDLFLDAQALGLSYPYDGLSLVETPNELRVYGGGWRMDSVQSMPGVMMLKENSFPTARFELGFANTEEYEDREGGIGRAKLEAIEQYFENDFNGGNLFTGIARNFLQFQTSARGEGAHAINFVLDELVARLLTERSGYFSAHEFDLSINTILGLIIQNLAQGRVDQIADALRRETTHKPSVWDRALGTPLVDLELTEAPRTALNALSLKSEAISRSILDGIGRRQTAALLAELIRQYRGQHFQLSDLYRIAERLEIDLEGLLGDWLHAASLPGFLISEVELDRLRDNDQGNPQYQTRVWVRNDEDTPGLIQLRYQWGSKKEPAWDVTGPMRIPSNSAIEVGIVTSTPLFQLWTQPYLALNRNDQRLALPKADSEQQIAADPFNGFRTSDWQPPRTSDIIVDDLDEGFAIWRDQADEKAQAIFDGDIDLDQGLPEYLLRFGNPRYWSRAVYSDSWGKYRRTHALIFPGQGNSHAAFTATLPHAGRWQLSYYLGINTSTDDNPQFNPGVLLRSFLGEFAMTLVVDGERTPIDFDGQQASFGWNELGDFQLPAGETSLEVANVTSGSVVIADAVRWRPGAIQ